MFANATFRTLATLGCLLAAAPPAAAQVIDSITPETAAFGTQVTIAGSGFGPAKPKVLLSNSEPKAWKLKVLSFSDTQVVAEVRKVPAGEWTLEVQPKGKGSQRIGAPLPLTVALPQDAAFNPPNCAAGEDITMTAASCGSKKGSVSVGGVKAKVLSWTAGVAAASGAGDGVATDTVVFRLGKKTPVGPQPVTVKNTAGEVTFPAAVDVHEPDPGGGGPGIPGNPYSSTAPGIQFLIDGVASQLFGTPYKDFLNQGTTTHKVWSQSQGFQKIEVYVDYFNNVPPSPTKTKTLQQPKVHIVYSTLGGIWSTTANPAVGDVLPGTSATITVTGQVQSFFGPSFGGAFSGTLVKVMGSGPDTITITDGFFWTTFSPG